MTIELVLNTGESLKEVVRNNFSIYRKKNIHSPLFLISKDKEVFEIGYFDGSCECTYKKSDIVIDKILDSVLNEYEKIDDVKNIPDFQWGIYALVQDMCRLKSEHKQ